MLMLKIYIATTTLVGTIHVAQEGIRVFFIYIFYI